MLVTIANKSQPSVSVAAEVARELDTIHVMNGGSKWFRSALASGWGLPSIPKFFESAAAMEAHAARTDYCTYVEVVKKHTAAKIFAQLRGRNRPL